MERSCSLIPRYAFQVLSIVDLAESMSEHYNQTRETNTHSTRMTPVVWLYAHRWCVRVCAVAPLRP